MTPIFFLTIEFTNSYLPQLAIFSKSAIYEDKDKIIVKNADEGEYGFEEKLFTRAINNISQDSSQIFSLLEDSFNDKININLEDLYE
jgi:hypothetical protein